MPKTLLVSDTNSGGIARTASLDGRSLPIAAGALFGANGSRTLKVAGSCMRGKRLSDICLSLILLVLFLPVIALIAIAIWVEGDGPLLYVSERIGRHGRPFAFYKFRTMIVNADSLRDHLVERNERSAVLFKISDDPRITRVGRLLRKYSLDEIPQLINVLRGEMSLVGPRPPLASEVEQYDPQHLIRLIVLPGLTGLWQVHARTSPSFHDYISLDLAYVENWSVWLDVKILWRTVGVVLGGTGR